MIQGLFSLASGTLRLTTSCFDSPVLLLFVGVDIPNNDLPET